MDEVTDIETPLKQVKDTISSLREKKGREEETLQLIKKALEYAHDFVVNLILEKHLVYQHEVMKERAKPKEKQDRKRINKYTQKMLDAVFEAETYVKQNALSRWVSRVQARLGRAYDYKGEFEKAARAYKKAIKTAGKDPEVVNEGVPRELEYQGYLAYSMMMSGKVKKSLDLAKKAYKKLNAGKGKKLKKEDYPTWAIWRSGIVIRTIDALLELGEEFDKSWAKKWLSEAESLLKVPKGSKKWVGKIDFGFRKDEVRALERKLD